MRNTESNGSIQLGHSFASSEQAKREGIEMKDDVTTAKSKWAATQFKEWLVIHGMADDFEEYCKDELAQKLKQFYGEMNVCDGKSLVGLRAGIHRYLLAPPYCKDFNIIADPAFIEANKVLVAKVKHNLKRMMTETKIKKLAISADNVSKLYSTSTLGVDNPKSLRNKVFFELALHFCIGDEKDWQRLQRSSIIFMQDEQNKNLEYATFVKSETVTGAYGVVKNIHSVGKSVKMREERMYSRPNDSLCPVKSLKLYLSKLSISCPNLFQKCSKDDSAENHGIWYGQPMSACDIKKIMTTISKQAGLSRIYTNDCIRATPSAVLLNVKIQPFEEVAFTKSRDTKCQKSMVLKTAKKTVEQTRTYCKKKRRFVTKSTKEIKDITFHANLKTANKERKTNKWAVKQFKEWLTERGMDDNFEADKPEELAKKLRKFYGEANSYDGKEYSKSTLVGLRAGISRYLQSLPSSKHFHIIKDSTFTAANKVLVGRIKLNRKKVLGQAVSKTVISSDDIVKLYSTGTLGNNSPKCLQSKVFFDLLLHFSVRGRKRLHSLQKSSFTFKKDEKNENLEYVTLNHNKVTEKSQGLRKLVQEQRMYSKPNDPMCPVKSLKLYLSKLSKICSSFLQRCRKLDDPESEDTWYLEPLGKNCISQLMERISQRAGLSQIYTNNTIQTITPNVFSFTKASHKRKTSLNDTASNPTPPYMIKSLNERKRNMSDMLYGYGKILSNSVIRQCNYLVISVTGPKITENCVNNVMRVKSESSNCAQHLKVKGNSKLENRDQPKTMNGNSENRNSDQPTGMRRNLEQRNHEQSTRFAKKSHEEIQSMACEIGEEFNARQKSQTKWAVKQFKEWLSVRGMDENFEGDKPEVLAQKLRQFYGEAKNSEGKEYSKSSLIGLRTGINRHLQAPPYCKYFNINIDPVFAVANKVLLGKIKVNIRNGHEQSKHKSSISLGDVNKMYLTGTLANDNPESLQHKVFFELALHFSIGNRGWHNLQKSAVCFTRDDQDENLICVTLRHQENTMSRGSQCNPAPNRGEQMYSRPNDPLCPVKSLKLYLSKLSPSCSNFFQKCRKTIDINNEKVWYSEILGKNYLNRLMTNISKSAGLSQVYTNDCIRATSSCVLQNAAIDFDDGISFSVPNFANTLNEHRLNSFGDFHGNDVEMEQNAMFNNNLESVDTEENEQPTRFVRKSTEEIESLGQAAVMTEPTVLKDTKKQTNWAAKLFKDWLIVRDMDDKFEVDEPEELAKKLKQFYAEASSYDGKEYTKSSLIGLRAGINRYLQYPPYNKEFSIISSPAFSMANEVLLGRIKLNLMNGVAQKKQRSVISPNDISKMYSTGTLGNDNPESLQNKVFFELALHFCVRGKAGWQNVEKTSISFMTDVENGGLEYVTLAQTEAAPLKNRDIGENIQKRHERMYAKPNDPLCPVRSLKLYLTKLSPNYRSLFQHCRKKMDDLASQDVWYERPMGLKLINDLMRRISVKAELSQIYTNNCIRLTTSTVLIKK